MAEPSKTQERGPFTQTLLEAAKLHREAQVGSYAGRTSSLSDRVKGSKAGSTGLGFGADLPDSVAMEQSLQRFVRYWRQVVEAHQAGRPADARKAKTSAILKERGVDPTAVAFVYGSTTEAVKRLRGRNGFDPDTGLRIAELRQQRIDGKPTHPRPLTAPAPAAVAELESRAPVDGDGDE